MLVLRALLACAKALAAQNVAVTNLDGPTYHYAVTEERRTIFAANMALGPAEGERFWKIYDEYVTTALRMSSLAGIPLVAAGR
jgi:hypothetical protein